MKLQFLAVQKVSQSKTLDASVPADEKFALLEDKNLFLQINTLNLKNQTIFTILSQLNRQDSRARLVFLFQFIPLVKLNHRVCVVKQRTQLETGISAALVLGENTLKKYVNPRAHGQLYSLSAEVRKSAFKTEPLKENRSA